MFFLVDPDWFILSIKSLLALFANEKDPTHIV